MSTKPVQIIAIAIDTAFEEIQNRLKRDRNTGTSKELTKVELQQLEGLIGESLLERSLDLIDKKTITCFKTKNGYSSILEIEGSQKEIYKFFPNINYCCCYSFRYHVLKNQQQYTCKHVLAARIADLLGLIKEEIVTDENFKYLLSQIKIVH